MNLSELRWRTQELMGVEMAHEQTDPGELDRLLNESYLHVCGLHGEWSFLDTTQQVAVVQGEQSYDLAPPMKYVRSIYDANDKRRGALNRLRRHEVAAADHHAGRPSAYALEGSSRLLVHPEPDAAYTLTVVGTQRAIELDDDADEPIFDAEYHPVVAYAAAALALASLDDDRTDRYATEVAGYLDRMRREYLVDHDEGPMQMGRRFDRIYTRATARPWQELW